MNCSDSTKQDCCYLCQFAGNGCIDYEEKTVKRKRRSCKDCIKDYCTTKECQEYHVELEREREYIRQRDNKDRQGSTGNFRDTWGGSIY